MGSLSFSFLFLFFLFADCLDNFLKSLGVELLGDDLILFIKKIHLRRSNHIIDIMPINIGLTSIEVEPIQVMLGDKLMPQWTGSVVRLTEYGESANIIIAGQTLLTLVDGRNHDFTMTACWRPKHQQFIAIREIMQRVGDTQRVEQY